MFKQTELKYKGVKLGQGDGSLYDFGCYLFSLCNGLNKKGYSFTPESLNEYFKNPDAWIGEFQNYIDVLNLNKYHPDIFVSFQQIEPWNDVPKTQDLLKDNLIVVCKVNASGIGGSGSHFVLLVGIENGVAVIHDPWTGNTEKITVRYGKLGNILGIRIFEVKPYNPLTNPTIEKLPKDTVVRDILTAMCSSTSDNEVTAYLNSNKNIYEIVYDVCKNNDRFFNTWVKPNIPAPLPPVEIPIPTPVPMDCKEVEEKLTAKTILVEAIKKVVYGKGWPWSKINSLKQLV